jgi:MoxR-like ATPase
MARRVKRVPRRKDTPQKKFRQLREQLADALLERNREIDGLLVALLAQEHILLLGPPGTAKTLLTEIVTTVLGSSYFRRLMTRFSTPEEVFGPLSVKGLKDDRYRRITTGMLPEVEIAFLDEIFKSNSSILNALLTLTNERQFDNDGQTVDCPLLTMVGASNELPEGEELEALYDRFALRYWTGCVSNLSIRELLGRTVKVRDMVDIRISNAELAAAQEQVNKVTIPEHILDLIIAVKIETEKAGFSSTDRRWVEKVPAILRAAAYLDGCDEVNEDHMLMLEHVLWRDPKDATQLSAIIAKVANPIAHAVQEIVDACKETYASIPFNQEIEDGKSSEVFNQIVDANSQFKKAVDKLKSLNGKSNRKVEEAVEEITDMHHTASRFAAKVSGLEMA